MRPDSGPGGISHGGHVITPFLWWLGLRGMLNRSYVLLSGLYFVVIAHFTASQLVLLGTSMSLTLLLTNVPIGVWADAVSRKWVLALGQLVLATAMVLTGLAVLVVAPDARIGGVGVLLVYGTAATVPAPVGAIWVNRRTTSEVRATVQSFLSQAESIGEVCGGFVLAALVQVRGIEVTLLTAGALLAVTGIMVAWSRADRTLV